LKFNAVFLLITGWRQQKQAMLLAVVKHWSPSCMTSSHVNAERLAGLPIWDARDQIKSFFCYLVVWFPKSFQKF